MFQSLRSIVVQILAIGWTLASLSGCGGGGGSSGSSETSTTPPPPISVTPSSVSVTAEQGTSATFTLTLVLSSQVSPETAHTFLQDPDNVLTSQFDGVSSNGPTSVTVGFHTSPTLAVGDHEGDFGFIVCNSSPCVTPYSATPANVHYKISITPAPPAATLTPAAINLTVEQGDPATVALDAALDSSISGQVQGFALVDAQGRFSSAVNYIAKSAGIDTVMLNLLPVNDAPGTYTGTVNLHVCNSYNCADNDDLPGSPISIPYTITVTPVVPLAAIPTATGLPEWETYQGNAGHTGYVPATLNPATFSTRWTWTVPTGSDATLSPVTTGSSKVLVAMSDYFSSASLVALNESDGSIAWHHDFGTAFTVDDPAVFGGRVFVATTSSDQSTYMWSFDVTDGTFKFQTQFMAQWEHYLAPTVKDNYVYTDGGEYGGMYAFKATSGANKWFASLNQYDLWTPAIDNNYAYAYTGYEFAAINLTTGSRAFSVADSTFNWWGYSLNISPVLPGDDSILVVNGIFDYGYAHANNLISYSISGEKESWRVDGYFASNPVVDSSGKLYLLNATGNQLEARDETTGSVLWTWQPSDTSETMPIGNLVLTNNLVFLSTSAATYAIDLTTHQSVWSTPHVGTLALSSNKVLYIVSQSDETIYAYTLN